jgi:hypothetical protein
MAALKRVFDAGHMLRRQASSAWALIVEIRRLEPDVSDPPHDPSIPVPRSKRTSSGGSEVSYPSDDVASILGERPTYQTWRTPVRIPTEQPDLHGTGSMN